MKTDLVIIGAGPAGLAAAVAAYDNGVRDLLLLERDTAPGGILQQCIHNGFGLHRFGEELTGPEYAARDIREANARNLPILTETMVLSVSPDRTVTAMNRERGVFTVEAKAVILAMGCRERPRGALNIPGARPSGIYTAGTAQRFVNVQGYLPGKEVVILGSGDIGLIMARRMTLEGAHVHAVCELMPYSGGLNRNIVQCLRDFDIPLLLSHTVSKIHGKTRLTGVSIAQVDEHLRVMPETEQYIPCDTLLLSCGLLPENELTKGAGIPLDPITGGATVNERRETELPGVFACGNVLHVHDLVDFVSEEAQLAGMSAAESIRSGGKTAKTPPIPVRAEGKVRYTVPQRIDETETPVRLFFRVGSVADHAVLTVKCGETVLATKKKRRMTPGEMESFELSPAVLQAARELGAALTICVE
ncbi:MAG: FAD-dependent oxidoreductase [Oscillospiraceae bacterium]|nr:FAD-dependent oxidoreductase [Oscillospiraceae bacterium]